jgi:hypothetical protein
MRERERDDDERIYSTAVALINAETSERALCDVRKGGEVCEYEKKEKSHSRTAGEP